MSVQLRLLMPATGRREMDDFYLAASNFDEQIRDPDEVIYESDFQEFVVSWAMRLIAAGTRITGPKQSLQILINQHGPAAVLQAVKEYEKTQKGDLANDSDENTDRDVAVLELESV